MVIPEEEMLEEDESVEIGMRVTSGERRFMWFEDKTTGVLEKTIFWVFDDGVVEVLMMDDGLGERQVVGMLGIEESRRVIEGALERFTVDFWNTLSDLSFGLSDLVVSCIADGDGFERSRLVWRLEDKYPFVRGTLFGVFLLKVMTWETGVDCRVLEGTFADRDEGTWLVVALKITLTTFLSGSVEAILGFIITGEFDLCMLMIFIFLKFLICDEGCAWDF